MNIYDLSSYDYELPESQIAQSAHHPAHQCKLLHCQIDNDTNIHFDDCVFEDIVDILTPDHYIYFNNSKVVPSRIYISDPKLSIEIYNSQWNPVDITDGELFWTKQIDDNIHEFLVRPGSKLKTGSSIYISSSEYPTKYKLQILDNTDSGRKIQISLSGSDNINSINIFEFLSQFGNLPLPPYISYDKSQDQDYQPVFAKTPWSVASPTASLHFTDYLLEKLTNKWINQNFVTLHVGMWTFKNISTDDITKHDIHSETAEIDTQIFQNIFIQKSQNKKILAVGTTSARTLESIPYVYIYYRDFLTPVLSEDCIQRWDKLTKNLESKYIYNLQNYQDKIIFDTKIYIYYWFTRKIVDKLITNFHLPKSSLMVLVSSMMWYENMMNAYDHAIFHNYRFYSLWDAMYIDIP